jgi:hypothetical protein
MAARNTDIDFSLLPIARPAPIRARPPRPWNREQQLEWKIEKRAEVCPITFSCADLLVGIFLYFFSRMPLLTTLC